MDLLAQPMLWCIVQVTFVALLGWLLCTAVSRLNSRGAAIIPAVALTSVLLLTTSNFVPWPKWWRFDSVWQAAAERVHSTGTDVIMASDATAHPSVSMPFLRADEEIIFNTRKGLDLPAANIDIKKLDQNAMSTIREHLQFWLPTIVMSMLGFGAVLGLLRLAGGLLSVRNFRRTSRPLCDAELLELAECLRAELCLKRKVQICQCKQLTTAAAIGWIRPMILLPPTWHQWTLDQRRAVLAHELAHVARGDFLACVFAQLSLALHFYHPLIHWLAARLRLEQELAADATAASLAGGRRIYLQSLAELALQSSERSLGWPAHTFLPTQGTFLRRIEMLRDSKQAPIIESRGGIIQRRAAVGLLIIGAIAIAGLRGGPATTSFNVTANAQPLFAAKPVEPSSSIELTHVNNDARMLVVVRAAEIAQMPGIRMVLDGAVRAGIKPFSLVTSDGLEQITYFAIPGADKPIIVLLFSKPTTFDTIAKADAWPADALRVTAEVVPDASPHRQAYAILNDRTIVLGESVTLSKYLSNRRKGEPSIASGRVWDSVSKGSLVAAIDMELVRDEFRSHPANTAGETFANLLSGISPLWTDSEYVMANIIVEDKIVRLKAIATCHDAELAEHVAETVTAAQTLAKNLLRAVPQSERKIVDVAQLGMEIADGLLKSLKVERNEKQVVCETNTELPTLTDMAGAGSLVEAISRTRVSAQRIQAMNNLKQIMLAMYQWAETVPGGRLPPPVIMGKDGKGTVPHSWRVELLPYLDQVDLYRQYNFDEPWDSEGNKRVLEKMPSVFRHPAADAKTVSSAYYVLTVSPLLEEKPEARVRALPFEKGFPTAFSVQGGMGLSQIIDGTSNTIAVVEANRDIPWTKPEDILFDVSKDPPQLGGFFMDGFNVSICDGSVRFLTTSFDSKILKLMIMPADGQSIPQE